MRTSLNEIKLIDNHLFKTGAVEDALLFDAMLILNPALHDQIRWQKNTHTIIRQYSRKKLRAEIGEVHQKLFNDPEHRSFREKIMRFFS